MILKAISKLFLCCTIFVSGCLEVRDFDKEPMTPEEAEQRIALLTETIKDRLEIVGRADAETEIVQDVETGCQFYRTLGTRYSPSQLTPLLTIDGEPYCVLVEE